MCQVDDLGHVTFPLGDLDPEFQHSSLKTSFIVVDEARDSIIRASLILFQQESQYCICFVP